MWRIFEESKRPPPAEKAVRSLAPHIQKSQFIQNVLNGYHLISSRIGTVSQSHTHAEARGAAGACDDDVDASGLRCGSIFVPGRFFGSFRLPKITAQVTGS